MNDAIKTDKAIFFHTLKQETLSGVEKTSSGNGLSITVHDIHPTPTGDVVGAGRLLSECDKQSLRDYLNGDSSNDLKWLPENLLSLSGESMVWYVPSATRKMHIRLSTSKQISLDITYPSLVFMADADGKLSVAAYAGTGRPSLSKPLYHAPLWNIYSGTSVCLGGATTPKTISPDTMGVWEDAIFNTLFSHSNHDYVIKMPKSKSCSNKDYLRIIKDKAKTKTKFAIKELTPLNKTLEQWAS